LPNSNVVKFEDAWGFSKLDVFKACKAKFKYQFIDKLDISTSSPAMDRGSKMHENIEGYLNGWVDKLIPEVENWKDQLDVLKSKDYKAEQALGFNKDWTKRPNWFGKDCWLRVKMDASYKEGTKGVVIDFKSGKYRIPSLEQIELYALAGFCIYPDVEEVDAEMWYLDTGDIYRKTYKSEHVPGLKKKYEVYAGQIYAEELWPTEPSMECRYCLYSKTREGPCRY